MGGVWDGDDAKACFVHVVFYPAGPLLLFLLKVFTVFKDQTEERDEQATLNHMGCKTSPSFSAS